MPKFTVEGVEYNSEDLSERGNANLNSLKYTTGKIKELETEIRVYETARHTYAVAIKAELEALKSS